MEIFLGHLLCGVIGGSQLLHELYLSCLECSIAAFTICVTEIIFCTVVILDMKWLCECQDYHPPPTGPYTLKISGSIALHRS